MASSIREIDTNVYEKSSLCAAAKYKITIRMMLKYRSCKKCNSRLSYGRSLLHSAIEWPVNKQGDCIVEEVVKDGKEVRKSRGGKWRLLNGMVCQGGSRSRPSDTKKNAWAHRLLPCATIQWNARSAPSISALSPFDCSNLLLNLDIFLHSATDI